MSNRTFNLDDELYEEFSKKHKGDMSSIITQLITNYLNIKKENLELSKLRDQLKEVRTNLEKLKTDESNLLLYIAEMEAENKKVLAKEQEEEESIRIWAKSIITDAQNTKQYTDLVYEAEQKGFGDVEEYLINKWHKG